MLALFAVFTTLSLTAVIGTPMFAMSLETLHRRELALRTELEEERLVAHDRYETILAYREMISESASRYIAGARH